ncbi:MAG: hypothetical protein NT087_13235 [Deltaproteobacteria bacterium]|nr:hypothetical protein [Deltaproteobacteria bacterium]
MGWAGRFFLFVVWCCLIVTVAQSLAQAGQATIAALPLLGSNVVQQGGPEVWHPETVSLPVFGAIRLTDFSLPALAVLIGLADGFNPCAMWALVYLLSLLVTLQDRRKIWLLVGSFVLASGVLYFLFMTAWLNAFLLLGYLRPLTIAIGAGALVIGAVDLRAFVLTRGAPVCEVGSPGFKKRTMGRMERLVAAPLSLASFLGVIALAFTVNAIEFLCSAGLPAIFTHTLSLRQLSVPQYYGYILLYDFFFMLDDLLIFSLAVFTLRTTMASGYAHYGKLVGGIVLVGLGLLMLLAPEMLR